MFQAYGLYIDEENKPDRLSDNIEYTYRQPPVWAGKSRSLAISLLLTEGVAQAPGQ